MSEITINMVIKAHQFEIKSTSNREKKRILRTLVLQDVHRLYYGAPALTMI